ncbi:hypothetical protein, partial [Roseibium denhamense]|uniref:hypothetical protein n=1 Tax=Roseibium denhamense TaxID=76305 RepID=UPI0024B63749
KEDNVRRNGAENNQILNQKPNTKTASSRKGRGCCRIQAAIPNTGHAKRARVAKSVTTIVQLR